MLCALLGYSETKEISYVTSVKQDPAIFNVLIQVRIEVSLSDSIPPCLYIRTQYVTQFSIASNGNFYLVISYSKAVLLKKGGFVYVILVNSL